MQGAIYAVDEPDLERLDQIQGVDEGRFRRVVLVVRRGGEGGDLVEAHVFIGNPKDVSSELRPRQAYLDRVLKGRDLFARDYYEMLAQEPVFEMDVQVTPEPEQAAADADVASEPTTALGAVDTMEADATVDEPVEDAAPPVEDSVAQAPPAVEEPIEEGTPSVEAAAAEPKTPAKKKRKRRTKKKAKSASGQKPKSKRKRGRRRSKKKPGK